MGYVVYDTVTKSRIRVFGTLRGAKISLAAHIRRGHNTFAVMDADEFEATYNKWTTTKNLLTGEEVRIREQDVGSCIDPGTERYWTM